MAKIADRVKETTTTTGTGTYTLAGAVTGYRAFTSAFSNADTVEYAIDNGTDWEVGTGVFTTSGTTLTRASIRASSNAGSAVNWGAGTKNIWCNAAAANLDPSRPAPIGDVTPNTGAFTTGNFSGTLTAQGLIDISGASAGQIKFPASQNASSNANTLDDYEEGTWTPIDSSGASLTFASGDGTYTRVGRMYNAGFSLQYPTTASGADAKVGGLPYAVGSAVGSRVGFMIVNNAATTQIAPFPVASTTTFNWLAITTGSVLTNVQITAAVLYGMVIAHV